MDMVNRQFSPSFVDVLVTVICVLVVAAVLVPQVHAARAVAARTECQDRLETLGRGFHAFEQARGGFPPRRTGFQDGSPYGGWGPFLLPFIDEAAVAAKYDFRLDCFDPSNQAAVETEVGAFRCPDAPGGRHVAIQSQATAKSRNPDKDSVFTVRAAVNDFIACNGVLLPRKGYGLHALDGDGGQGNRRQAMSDDTLLPLASITDGLGCTLLLIEQAGRPDVWRNGKKHEGGGQFGMSANARGAWAGWGSIGFGPSGADGLSSAKGDATDCTVNCNNWFGIYGFHPGGGHILLCDGAVRFVSPALSPLTFAYLSNRDDGRLISPTDF